MSDIKTPAICGKAVCGQTICGQIPDVINIIGIKIGKMPNKVVYKSGEKFLSAGLELFVVYSDGRSEKISDMSELSFTPVRSLKTTDKYITVAYKDHTIKFPIVVTENVSIYGTAIYNSEPAPLQITRSLNRAGTGSVDLFSGDLTFVHNDVAYKGERLPLNISHIYSSKIAQIENIGIDGQNLKPVSGFGKGWALNLSQRLFIYPFDINQNNKIEEAEKKIVYLDAKGDTHTFISTNRKGIQSDRSASIFLDEKGSGKTIAYDVPEYKLYDDMGNVLVFEHLGGRLTEMTTGDGAVMRIKYDDNKDYENSRIISVTDGAGRKATFEYNSKNLLERIIEPTGKKTKYVYDTNDRLTDIVYLGENDVESDRTIFTYSNGSALMESVTDPIGYRTDYHFAMCANGLSYVCRVADSTTIESLSCNGVEEYFSNNDDYISILHYRNNGTVETDDYSYIVKTITKSGIVNVYHFNADGLCCLQYEGNNAYEFFAPKNIMHYNYTDNYSLQTLKIPSKLHSNNLLSNGSFENHFITNNKTTVNGVSVYAAKFDNWNADNSTTAAFTETKGFTDSKGGLKLSGTIYQDIDLFKVKSRTHYLLSGWVLSNFDAGTENVKNELRVSISYRNGEKRSVEIPIDKKARDFKFLGKTVYVDDVDKIVRIRIEVENNSCDHTFGTVYDELRFEEIQEVGIVDNTPCLIVDTGTVQDFKPVYKKYGFDQVTKLSVKKGTFTTANIVIDKNKPITPTDFYVMHTNDKLIYYKAEGENIPGNEDAFVTFDDGGSYKVKKVEVYNSGRITSVFNGKSTVQEKNAYKDVAEIVYNDNNGKSFKEIYEYNDEHKRVKATDYRDVVAQNTFGDLDVTSAVFPRHGVQKIVRSQGYTDDKNHVLYETDERHTDSDPIKRVYEYDVMGNVIKCTFPDGSVVNCDYDMYTGLPTRVYSVINGQLSENKYTYIKGLLVKIEVNDSDTYTFRYDGYGNMTGVFYNGIGMYHEYTQFGYDYADNDIANFDCTESVIAGKTYKTYFDRYGKAIKTTQSGLILSENFYDAETDRVTSVKDYGVKIATGKTEDVIAYEYCYKNNGDIAALTINGCGHNIILRNNVLDERVIEQEMCIDGELYTYGYEYDGQNGAVYPDNTVSSINLSNGANSIFTVDYTNDDYGRFGSREIKNADGDSVCKEQRAYLNTSAYRTTGYVSALTNTAKGYSEQINYAYTKNGEIYTVGKSNNIFERYKYDALGRLVREDNRAFNKTVVYAYDTYGNISSKTVNVFTLSDTIPVGMGKTYDYADSGIRGRLTSYDGKSLTEYISKPYSDNGYPQVYFKHGSTDFWKMQWNGSSLKSMRLCNSVGTEKADSIEYLYNGNGVRTKKTVNGIDTDYIYVGSRLFREVKDEYRIDYMYGIDGIIGFEITRSNGAAERYYYIKNIQGDITHIVDSNGSVVVQYAYDAWGNCKVYDPEGKENGDEDFIGNINPIRYRGYYYDVETKLYYLLSRYYDAEVGRFISPDSVEYIEPETLGGLNLYSYCYNNPAMYIDPSGTSAFISFLIGLGIAATIGAAVGAASYTASVFITGIFTGEFSWSWGMFLGSILGGAIGGALTYGFDLSVGINAGLTGGLSTAIGMSLSNALGESHSSGLEILAWTLVSVGISGIVAGFMNMIKIPKLSGRGGYGAVTKQIFTKFHNGLITNVSAKTIGKMFTYTLAYSMLNIVADSVIGIIQYFMSKKKNKKRPEYIMGV